MRRPPRSLPNKHDFADGDDVLGSFFAMGPGIKPDLRLMGFEASVYDVAPTILHIYGIEKPAQMRSHVLSEILKVQIPRGRRSKRKCGHSARPCCGCISENSFPYWCSDFVYCRPFLLSQIHRTL